MSDEEEVAKTLQGMHNGTISVIHTRRSTRCRKDRTLDSSDDESSVQPQKQAKTSKTSKTTTKGKKKTLGDTVKEQKHYIRTLEGRVKQLTTNVKTLEEQLSDAKEQVADWKRKVKDLQALKKGSTMETVEILQKQLTKLQGATDQAKSLQKENTTLRTKLLAAEQSKASYKSELTMLKKQLSKEETTQRARLSIDLAEQRAAVRTQHDARRRQERSQEKQQDQQKQRERIQYMSQGVFNNGGMVGMPPPPNFGVAGPQNLFQPNGQVMNPMQYNQLFQNPAYQQQQPTYQPQVAGLVQQLIQVLQPNNSNPASYNNYNNVPIFDPRDAYTRGRGNPHGGSQSFDNESNRGGGDGSTYAEFMRGDPDGTELDGDGVDDRGRGRGRDSDRELVFDRERGDSQRMRDPQSDNEYDYNPPCFEDYDVPNSQDSKAVSDSEDQP